MDGLVVTGGEGRLAAALGRAAPGARLLSRRELDVTLPASIGAALDTARPRLVINTAALADVDRCEAEPELAHAVNAQGPRNLAAACAARGIPLIHVSTDYVFGSEGAEPFSETAAPCPWGVYGASKARGEALALEAEANACVVRVAWLFGDGEDFLSHMLKKAIAERQVEVFAQIGSPTPLSQAAERFLTLAARMVAGEPLPVILHLAGGPPASRAAWLGAALTGYSASHPGFSCEVAEIAAPGPRPPFSALNTALSEQMFGGMMCWRTAASVAGSMHA